jgi:hypothetical protein
MRPLLTVVTGVLLVGVATAQVSVEDLEFLLGKKTDLTRIESSYLEFEGGRRLIVDGLGHNFVHPRELRTSAHGREKLVQRGRITLRLAQH